MSVNNHALAIFTLPLLVSTLVSHVSSSAIPMWEFLSRNEKMSHLYNIFVQQVAGYCDTSNMPDCNKVLLIYGVTNLAKMDNESLDKLDPYQRGSNDIIWESMIKGTYVTPSSVPNSKNQEHDYYADALEPNTDENHLGSASNKVEEILPTDMQMGGPMVVRVLPDGSPVPGDEKKPLPKDEDSEEFIALRSKPIPSISEIIKNGTSVLTGLNQEKQQ